MKTLILNGSPRRGGETASLVYLLEKQLPGQAELVRAYGAGISPCIDCRACRTRPGCAIDDKMTALYETIRECDAVVIASPVYFSELTGPLLGIASRLQTFFCARRFRGEDPGLHPKRGGVILVGGGSGAPGTALKTANILLREMNCTAMAEPVIFTDTDRRHAREDEAVQSAIAAMAAFLAEGV